MQRKIFYSILSACIILLIFANVFLAFSLENFFKQQTLQSLKQQTHTLKPFIPLLLSGSNLEDLEIEDTTHQLRITLLNQNGDVLYDNTAKNLPNHSDRKEFQEALANKESFIIRRSDTIGMTYLYYALSTTVGDSKIILRVSTSQNSIIQLLLEVSPYFLCEILLALLGSFLLARFLTKAIVKPILNIDTANLKNDSLYQELHSFVHKIKTQNKTIKTQYKRLEQKQQEILQLIENMNDGLILLNAHALIVNYNKSATLYFENLPNINSLYQINDSLFLQYVTNAINEFKNHKDKKEYTTHMYLKNKECEILFSPIRSKNKIKGLMIILRDVTAAQKAQNLRREFSANVTHELKTPLTSILASAEMLKNNLVDSKDTSQFLGRIYSESKRLLEMIDEILKLSFFDENKQDTLKKTHVNLKAIVLKVVQRLSLLCDKHQIDFNLNLEECYIIGVSDLLENLVYNLCDNAIKYNNPNGEVRIHLYQTNQAVYLSVKDNGMGIPKDMHERIFERFFCVDKSRSKKLGGTGLGLSIVKSVAYYHNASIDLKSTPTKGSDFIVKFPIQS